MAHVIPHPAVVIAVEAFSHKEKIILQTIRKRTESSQKFRRQTVRHIKP